MKEEYSMTSRHSIVQPRTHTILVLLIVPILLLTSCGAIPGMQPTAVPPIDTATPTPEAATPTPAPVDVVPTATQAPVEPPTPIPPTPTPQELQPAATPVLASPTSEPPAPNVNAASSIAFTPGTTATVVQGTLQPGQVMAYTLNASQGQALILIMDSPNKDVTLGVFAFDGNKLLDPAAKLTNWQGTLPRTEQYTIQVTGGAVVENFTLTVKIAQIVTFAAGTSSITLNGTTVNGYLFDYSLNCGAGQVMTAALNVAPSIATLDIFGLTTGEALLYASANANTWSGILPDTQDYVIEVLPKNAQVVNYALTVSCTGAVAQNPTQTAPPTATTPSAPSTPVVPPVTSTGEIVFAPLTTAAEVHGTIGPGQIVTYTVQAPQYHPLILNLDSAALDAVLGVLFPDGSTLLSPSKGWRYWQWRIPQTGLYTIQIYGGSTQTNYALTVKIPEIVYFAPGSTSKILYGDTNLGFVRSYAFYLSFGQTLTASLNVTNDKAYLDIFGLETGSILGYQSKSSSWTGVLPATQMYIIEVVPRGGYLTGYALTVSVK
jgi:hypothetical protein